MTRLLAKTIKYSLKGRDKILIKRAKPWFYSKISVINLCEIKFSTEPFTITKSYAAKLQNKIGVFKTETETRKAVWLTMITTFGLKKNEYSGSLVQHDLDMNCLFE